MTTLHINAVLLAVMLFIIQLAIIFLPAQGFDNYQPLLAYLITGNGDGEVAAVELILSGTMFSPMGALIFTMKWFAGINPKE